MFDQSADFKILSLNVFNTASFGYLCQKGVIVEKVQEWHELISKVVAQDCRLSFKKIFDHFYPLLINQNMKSGLTKELASELAQETMIKVWGQAKSFDPIKGNFELWIYVISRNVRFDYFRKVKNDPLRLSSSDVYSDFDLADEKDMETLFDVKQLAIYIGKLSNDQRDVIQKIYFEGLTQQEVAQEFNIPLGTVKSRVRLAMNTLQKLREGN